jgi:hypothetical protein
MPVDTNTPAAVAKSKNTRDTSVDAAVSNAKVNSGKVTAPTVAPNIEKTSAPGDDKTAKKEVNRGLDGLATRYPGHGQSGPASEIPH